MGGDHQCPVCQATFTRPQHVARHMRSHTGDRPYKCQYCGDQFARSDLLSRHVNKCHANEKPPQTATNGRRKGSASTSRATTSKQACDQCVQSSLPCDGCNPCSKCVQRKSRCTYVKFHRQTAPSGPGHHVPRPTSLVSSLGNGRLSMDDFILGPSPLSVPSMDPSSGDPLYTTPFSFNHVYASSANAVHLPMSLSSDSEISGRSRAQAELLRHAGAPMLANPQGSPALLPELYTDHNQPSNNWLGWGESTNPGLTTAQTGQPQFASLDEAFSQNHYGADGSDNFNSEMFTGPFIGLAYRPRRDSVDYSDGSSTSQSIPSSATSSNVHLPLSAGDMYQGASEDFQQRMLLDPQRRRDSVSSTSAPESHDQQPDEHSGVGEGGFSSAFGLMSIDDPNVLAGLSTDGVPFFSNAAMNMRPHSPNVTPMPPKALSQQQLRDRGMSLSALPTPGLGRDNDFMWRAFIRTPMSGPQPVGPETPGTMPQSPSSRRRVRVSSLPSSKTPTAERALPGVANGNGEGARMTPQGNPEDLRSYEAAVNARNASLNLNLPKRRGTRANPPASVSSGACGTNCRTDTTRLHPNVDFDLNASRPSSSSSTSSLSQAFMSPHLPPMKGAAPPMNGVSISLPVPRVSSMGSSSTQSGSRDGSRESSVASDCTGSSEGEIFRPAFKRLPSQTLGPANAKRAQFEKNGVADKGSIIVNGDRSLLGVPNGSPRHTAALPGRACQMSDKRLYRNGLSVPRQ
ncbi:uncharacterized protein EDB93DRAFT_1085348 [Suillus bovinus]|uniref:uncharacterized protein n=1 Tax=Suillus bovinus TaxID=48563 RepID=UPI001B8845C8|nr:uncharacterized protein EDB93DRAFT_1085348 [Suillus bovinus]KAG2147734.1 hypothetical protein EDB93DRAFT_1085348 [Suillus bovinus]